MTLIMMTVFMMMMVVMIMALVARPVARACRLPSPAAGSRRSGGRGRRSAGPAHRPGDGSVRGTAARRETPARGLKGPESRGGRGGVGGCVKERGFRQNQTLLAIRFDTTAEGYARWVLQDGPPGWRTASQPRTPYTHTTKPNQLRVLPAQGARESLGARCSRIPPQRSRRSQAPLSDSDCAGRNAATGSGP